jgi:hypothetical protein
MSDSCPGTVDASYIMKLNQQKLINSTYLFIPNLQRRRQEKKPKFISFLLILVSRTGKIVMKQLF